MNDVLNPNNEPLPFAYAPDYSLKKMIGDVPLKKIFTKEKIENCQKLIDAARDSFFETAEPSLKAVLTLLPNLQASPSNMDLLGDLVVLASGIRGQAETLGFPWVMELCEQLIGYAESDRLTDKKKALILSNLVGALELAFKRKISGKGGATEQALLSDLKKHAQ